MIFNRENCVVRWPLGSYCPTEDHFLVRISLTSKLCNFTLFTISKPYLLGPVRPQQRSCMSGTTKAAVLPPQSNKEI